MTHEEALHAILETLKDQDPVSLRKVELLTRQRTALEIALHALQPDEHPPPVLVEVEPSDDVKRHRRALDLVLGYGGRNRFMLDLRRSVDAYGGLTPRQVDAVLTEPGEDLLQELQDLGWTAELRYRFEAFDALTEARRRQRGDRQ